MTRVLILSGLQIFPAQSGGQLRTGTLAQSLAKQGCQVTVHSFTGRKREYLARVPTGITRMHENLQEYVRRTFFTGFVQFLSYKLRLPPFWLVLYTRFLLGSALKKEIAASDVVIADFPYLYPALKLAKKRMLNTHNIEHTLWNGGSWFRTKVLAPTVKAIEGAAIQCAHSVVVCSQPDLSGMQEFARPDQKFFLVPNGVDIERLSPRTDLRHETRAKLGISEHTRVILFPASYYAPNVEGLKFLQDFCRQNRALLDKLDIVILVVGSVSGSEIKEPGFVATSFVDRVEPYFSAADAGINPIFSGSGTNVKMFEFIAARLPILTTAFGARGLSLDNEVDCLVFSKSNLADVLELYRVSDVKNMAASAFEKNQKLIDMNVSVRELVAEAFIDVLPHSG